jgi:hypothetical protein
MSLADAETGNAAAEGNTVMIDSTNTVIILGNHNKVGRFGGDIPSVPSFFQRATRLIDMG